jgi:hypothetical protein
MENEDQDLKKSKTKKIIIIIVIFLAIFLFVSLITRNGDENNTKVMGDDNGTSSVEAEDDELSPEEVIARMDKEEGIGVEQGPVDVEIIGPEGEAFMPRQARYYQAQVLGLENGSSCNCDFKFYLNENNEEYLYKEMTNRGCTRRASVEGQVCGFTSSFIAKVGELRVHVDVEVEKQDEIVQTATADRMYIVK